MLSVERDGSPSLRHGHWPAHGMRQNCRGARRARHTGRRLLHDNTSASGRAREQHDCRPSAPLIDGDEASRFWLADRLALYSLIRRTIMTPGFRKADGRPSSAVRRHARR